MNGRLSGLHFGASVLIGPKLVADRHRGIALGRAPVALPAGLEGNRTIRITNACNAGGGIALVRSNRLRAK